MLSPEFKSVWVDSVEQYQRIVEFLDQIQPQLVSRVRLYRRDEPIFDEFGIEPEIAKALKSKVWLKSGGYIVINQTEALVAIDVNTGKYVGKKNLEETVFRTNLEAAKEIVRQIRLRDLGGIIVLDFIDMEDAGEPAEALRGARERDQEGPLEDEDPADLRVRPDRDDAQARAPEPGALADAGLPVLRRQRTDQVEHDRSRSRSGAS